MKADKNIKVTQDLLVKFDNLRSSLESKTGIPFTNRSEVFEIILTAFLDDTDKPCNCKTEREIIEVPVIREVPVEVIKEVVKEVPVGNTSKQNKKLAQKIIDSTRWIEKEIVWIPTNKNMSSVQKRSNVRFTGQLVLN